MSKLQNSFLQNVADEIEQHHSTAPFTLKALHPFMLKEERGTSALSASVFALCNRGVLSRVGTVRNPNGGGSHGLYKFEKSVQLREAKEPVIRIDEVFEFKNLASLNVCHAFQCINPRVRMIPL